MAYSVEREISFLQSSEWEQFQQRIGRKIWRAEGALMIQHALPFGFGYAYAPRPHFENKSDLKKFLESAEKVAKEEKSIFLRVEPIEKFQTPRLRWSFGGQASSLPGRQAGGDSPSADKFQVRESYSLQPQKTLILDLSKTEDALLLEMHPKTRYNIRLAARHGVVVQRVERDQFRNFFSLLCETSQRDGFSLHDERHYRFLFETRSDNFWNELYFARYEDKILAAALINFYGPSHTATYLHGASSRAYKEMMAPHLLHWEIIREAKNRGFGFYDFWGVDERRWPGVTRFKIGFGGQVIEYPSAVDVVYRPGLYFLYSVLRVLRRKR
ncbi:MAG: peptidoglycan bridge formation glycyltransferase FemA/FemB family protein [Candidatus Sungbacteria bacterium]|nr:peptidoglycan bridge formation glycyltransferase FemA/FemB family protein [Candidatus Sungbacteria bacterium]